MLEKSPQTALASLIIGRLPRTVRAAVFKDDIFCGSFGLKPRSTVVLGDGFAFDRDELFSASARALPSAGLIPIKTTSGDECTLEFTDENGPFIVVVKGQSKLLSPLLVLVGADPSLRIRALKALAKDVRLRPESLNTWKSKIEISALGPSQLDDLSLEIGNTIVGFMSNLQERLTSGRMSMDVLVPRTFKYFENLLPKANGQTDLAEYTNEVIKPDFDISFRRDEREALSRSAALAATERLVPFDAFDILDEATAFSTLDAMQGIVDPFSILSMISLCLHGQKQDNRYAALSEIMIDRLLQDIDHTYANCELFAGSYVSTLSRLDLVPEAHAQPLYWRRLIAFGHASLCTRVLGHTSISSEEFYKWALQSEGQKFFSFALLDKREAPRWRPSWIEPSQVFSELIGRLLSLCERFPTQTLELRLREKLDKFQAPMKSKLILWAPFYPGPLEGTPQPNEIRNKLTPDMLEEVKKSTIDKVGIERCAGIAVVGPIWDVPDDLIGVATKELDRSPIPSDAEGSLKFRAVLSGLAHIAGLKRSSELANLVASLGLRAALLPNRQFTLSNMLPDVLEAGAAFSDIEEQFEWIANVITTFAFSAKRKEDAFPLLGLIDTFRKYDKRLNRRLLRARAAASSLGVSPA